MIPPQRFTGTIEMPTTSLAAVKDHLSGSRDVGESGNVEYHLVTSLASHNTSDAASYYQR